MTLLYEKIRMFRKTNQVFIKRWRVKKTCIRVEGVLTIKDVYSLIEQKEIVRQQSSKRSVKEDVTRIRSSSLRYYGRCNKTDHNVRIC